MWWYLEIKYYLGKEVPTKKWFDYKWLYFLLVRIVPLDLRIIMQCKLSTRVTSCGLGKTACTLLFFTHTLREGLQSSKPALALSFQWDVNAHRTINVGKSTSSKVGEFFFYYSWVLFGNFLRVFPFSIYFVVYKFHETRGHSFPTSGGNCKLHLCLSLLQSLYSTKSSHNWCPTFFFFWVWKITSKKSFNYSYSCLTA